MADRTRRGRGDGTVHQRATTMDTNTEGEDVKFRWHDWRLGLAYWTLIAIACGMAAYGLWQGQ